MLRTNVLQKLKNAQNFAEFTVMTLFALLTLITNSLSWNCTCSYLCLHFAPSSCGFVYFFRTSDELTGSGICARSSRGHCLTPPTGSTSSNPRSTLASNQPGTPSGTWVSVHIHQKVNKQLTHLKIKTTTMTRGFVYILLAGHKHIGLRFSPQRHAISLARRMGKHNPVRPESKCDFRFTLGDFRSENVNKNNNKQLLPHVSTTSTKSKSHHRQQHHLRVLPSTNVLKYYMEKDSYWKLSSLYLCMNYLIT